MRKDKKELILDIARKHFLQKGYSATRTQEIADEAGINKAMLHYYFTSKEKLYQEIISRTLRNVIPKFAGAIGADLAFWERVEKIVDTYITTIIENPDIPIFIMYELSQKQEHLIIELKKQSFKFQAIQSFIQQMQAEMQAGRIRQIAPPHLVFNILGMTVFPFMAKPIFSTIFGASDETFIALMKERKQVIMDFLKHALQVD